MKRIIKLTEADLTNIVKRVLQESEINYDYFSSRGFDIKEQLLKIMGTVNPCKSVKLKTYFNKIFEKLILDMIFSNEGFRNEISDETIDPEKIEMDIRKYVIENHLDLIMTYYKLKCGGSPKY